MTYKLPTREIEPARLASSRSHQIPGKLIVTELFFDVPLDHLDPGRERIRIFCRSARKLDRPAAARSSGSEDEPPWFVFITGGPGFGSPPPQNMMRLTTEVLERGYQLLCLDHRGMGLSTPATAATITAKGTPEDQAAYLKYFRADNAVRDLEAIRKCLTTSYPEHKKKWTILGTSYGGYLCLTYLSFHSEGLREVFISAGAGPVSQSVPDEPIRRLFKKVKERNGKYYAKYPEDKANVYNVLEFISHSNNNILLPSGDALTVNRFLEMGLFFGFHGGLDQVHHIVLRAVNDIELFGYLTRPTLSEIENMSWFNNQPLYALLHGSVYAQKNAPNWVFDRISKEFPDFRSGLHPDGTLFTGEMVFRSAFENYGELKSLGAAAELLEKNTEWPPLYDLEQLQRNEVPVYAAIFVDDMYVDFEFSRETAAMVRGCKSFITNSLYHDAIRSRCEELLKRLFALRDDTLD
ncbi:uncharacterized protein Z518_07300 [Rhinocladiella mackenziei CBS 650.93]|uniref:AB hydrolase-1 domain-containing protein n=1 Tax=Rhinocladiella mackenziei CBS 650.93 TaxID=1442369 RepID=A0A0D2FNT1_9EURO|nr:uncharacterized protein Z518_07300 [Rhinocladiella mackenziei CBS 650.93]KIX03747.1 hypothetical protein Z518_07300 [Rhinocladiella mackenziei CBS 650.93]